MRMYHPHLGTEVDVPDDEDCIRVHQESGWMPAPEPESVPGVVPEPTVYAPVTKSRSKPKTTEPEAEGAAEGDSKR